MRKDELWAVPIICLVILVLWAGVLIERADDRNQRVETTETVVCVVPTEDSTIAACLEQNAFEENERYDYRDGAWHRDENGGVTGRELMLNPNPADSE